ncbi:hypothetical protein F2P56_008726 [Juglans regia]|uniref:Retrotransposon gag domain-containing protein n=1 Tax=Juglans regia TaxID=51240 RepID=A0A834CVJ5_JUGRE|nr:hypothetical protein F2P56_008726 [Juglans regia]
MAEGTRASLKNQQDGSQKQHEAVQKQLENHQQAINGMAERSDQVSEMLRSFCEAVNINPFRDREVSNDHRNHEERGVVQRGFRLDCPRFNGTDPADWVLKANQYFDFYQVPFHQKLMVASHHMDGEALVWYQSALDAGQFNSWESLVMSMQGRFGPSAFDDPMEALTKLRQTTSVSLYTSQFEALTNRLKGLSERHKLSCFISGLKDEIRIPIKMFNPPNLGSAFGLAKLQEERVLSSRNSWRQNGHYADKWPVDNGGDLANKGQRTFPPVRKVTSLQMDDKRKKGLCFHCDEKWNPNHTCKNPKVYIMQGDNEDKVEDNAVLREESVPETQELDLQDSEVLEVSIHAISGCVNSNAMKLLGRIGSFTVEILVDSGSTHNFLDPLVVEATKLKVEKDVGLQVQVANGAKIVSQGRCVEVVNIQDSKFIILFNVLTLGGCDIVLGVQWLKTLGSIKWDFTNMSMEFQIGDKKLLLQGLVSRRVEVEARMNLLKSSFVRKHDWFLQLVAVQEEQKKGEIQPEVEEMLQQFNTVFEEPVGLGLSTDLFGVEGPHLRL